MAGPSRPSLVIIAGPNGSGKTTFTDKLRKHVWLRECRYVNADEIARDEFGDWNSPEAVLKAARRADEIREESLSRGESLAFETVFSTAGKLTFLQRAARAGYFVRLFFVGTDDPEINTRRVAQRVLEGGHDVPEAKIRSRYHRSVNNLVNGLSWADRGYVLDNSVDGRDARLVLRTEQGKLAKLYEGEPPRWCWEVISTLDVSPWPDEDDVERDLKS